MGYNERSRNNGNSELALHFINVRKNVFRKSHAGPKICRQPVTSNLNSQKILRKCFEPSRGAIFVFKEDLVFLKWTYDPVMCLEFDL